MLSDFDLGNMIKSGRLRIDPFSQDTIRENGVDLRLSDEIARHNLQAKDFVLDPSDEASVQKAYSVARSGSLIIAAGEQVLLSTLEYVGMPDDLMGFVELRSTWARHGLSIPPTIVDAGFQGTITLEVVNNAPYAIKLSPGQRFAHVVFARTLSRVERPYAGYYSGQRGVTLPKKV
ncbi:MAG: dCTP deaminase [Thermoprotei archaeon]|nr:dCTP deaminase [TACK group archaeon]